MWGAAILKRFISYFCLEKSPSRTFVKWTTASKNFQKWWPFPSTVLLVVLCCVIQGDFQELRSQLEHPSTLRTCWKHIRLEFFIMNMWEFRPKIAVIPLWGADSYIVLQAPASPHLAKLLGWEEEALEESVRRFFPCDAPWEETEPASCLRTKPSAWMNYYHSFTWVITALSPLPFTHPACVFVYAPACLAPRDTLSDLSTTGSLQILFPDRLFTQPASRFRP